MSTWRVVGIIYFITSALVIVILMATVAVMENNCRCNDAAVATVDTTAVRAAECDSTHHRKMIRRKMVVGPSVFGFPIFADAPE